MGHSNYWQSLFQVLRLDLRTPPLLFFPFLSPHTCAVTPLKTWLREVLILVTVSTGTLTVTHTRPTLGRGWEAARFNSILSQRQKRLCLSDPVSVRTRLTCSGSFKWQKVLLSTDLIPGTLASVRRVRILTSQVWRSPFSTMQKITSCLSLRISRCVKLRHQSVGIGEKEFVSDARNQLRDKASSVS